MAKSLLQGSHFLVPNTEGSYGSYKWKPAATISVGLKITAPLIIPNVRAPAFQGYKVTSVPKHNVGVLGILKSDNKIGSHCGQGKLESREDHQKESGVTLSPPP